MKTITALLFAGIFTLSAPVAACEIFFKTEELCLTPKWEVAPTAARPGTMTVTFTDSEDRPLSPKNDFFFFLWMPGMGHGSTPVTITPVEDGVYSVTNVKFIMKGAWDIHYQLKDGNKVVEDKIQKISIR